MANRSDRTSVLPRQLKRQLGLMKVDAHRRGELRRLMISAHTAHKEAVKKRLTQKSDGLDIEGTTLAVKDDFTKPIERDKTTGDLL